MKNCKNFNLKRIVKISGFIFFLCITTTLQLIASNKHKQEARINLHMEDAKIESILKEIEAQSEYRFFYDSESIRLDETSDVDWNSVKIFDALSEVLGDKGITYRLIDKQIVLFLTGEEPPLVIMQKKMVTGVVSDQDNNPMPGVNVLIKGSSTGVVTDVDGRYSIEVSDQNIILVFSFIGFTTQEIKVGSQSLLDIVMHEESLGIEEIVVVGYGTQKKVNLTGSVESVSSKDLGKRTVTQASNLLQGKASGVSIRQTSGNPASNSASLLVRGRGTFSSAGTEPLVLVDGIESSMNAVNPNDIESVSVLKDAASAAIYGSKAANGVILITTKKGAADKLRVTYNGMVGKQKPTFLPKMVNSWEYAEIVNEAMTNVGQQKRYTDEEIQKFKSGSDPVNYPNFDHIDHLFGSGNGVETIHNIGVLGGNKAAQYLFSLGYYNQQGLIKRNDADRYDFRLNLNSELRKNLHLSVKLSGQKSENSQPISSSSEQSLSWIIRGAMRNSNAIPGLKPDGYYGRNESFFPEADLDSKSYSNYGSSYFYGNGDLVWEIIKDLKFTGQFGYTFNNSETKTFTATYPVTETYGITTNGLTNTWDKDNALTLQALIEYMKIFNDHQFQLLGGISSRSYQSNFISAFRNNFPNNEITEIEAGATSQATNNGSASKHKMASYFGRLNYNYKEKYLFEANFRYDGSSRFPSNNRWGFFPSASAAWRISEETFFKDHISLFNNFKLRVSWGELGNQSIGNYPYQDILYTGQNYAFANEIAAGLAVTTIPNTSITWETTKITDIGLDLGLFNNKLNFSFDYYKKLTSDILYNVSVSNMLGATPSSSNAGSVENKGFDINLSYRNSINDFYFDVSGVFSLVHNKVTKIANVERDISAGLFVGHPIGSRYGYISDGLFRDENDVANAPTQPFSVLANPGSIKFVDISGPDGVPDGIVNSTYDRDIIGTPLPITTYGFTINAEYKNFDINIFFQGEGGRKTMVDTEFFFALDNNGNVQRDYYDKRWTAENPNPKAIYPKILVTSTGFYNNNLVDYWFKNATFIRLKNLQIGYTLPQKLASKTFLNKARIYVTGENLFTITNFYKGWDPEMNTSSSFYPLVRLYALGINLEF